MGTAQGTTGVYWHVSPSGKAVSFFGTPGEDLGDGSWAVAAIQMNPVRTTKQTLETIIETDRANGVEHLIAEVRVGAVGAVTLFLNGDLTLAMLEASEETLDRIVVDMELSGAVRKLVIIPQPSIFSDPGVGTYDANGDIV